MATPFAKGLFQRGILESGTGIGAASRRDSAEADGMRSAFADVARYTAREGRGWPVR